MASSASCAKSVEKPNGRQTLAHRHGGIRIVLAEQNAGVVRSARSVDFAGGDLCPVGQFDKKLGTAAVGVRKTDGAAESRDDLARDAQPEAGATLLPRVGGLGLCEFLEDARPEILRDARAVIAHCDTHATVAVADR